MQISESTYGRRRTVKKMFEWMFVDEDEGVQISVFAADESEAREALNRIPGRSPDAEYYLIGIKSGLAAPYVMG